MELSFDIVALNLRRSFQGRLNAGLKGPRYI
jgi:hypothetical protein